LGNELLYTLLFLTRALLHAMTDGLPAPPAAGVAEIDDVRTTEADFSKRLLSRAASEMFGMVANEIRAEESVRDALASALLTFVFAQLLDMLLRNKTCDDINTIVTLCLSEFMDQLKDALFDLAVTQGAKSRPTNIKNLSNPSIRVVPERRSIANILIRQSIIIQEFLKVLLK
jgi:hypothetical protein